MRTDEGPEIALVVLEEGPDREDIGLVDRRRLRPISQGLRHAVAEDDHRKADAATSRAGELGKDEIVAFGEETNPVGRDGSPADAADGAIEVVGTGPGIHRAQVYRVSPCGEDIEPSAEPSIDDLSVIPPGGIMSGHTEARH